MDISIIICSYNRCGSLRRVLDTIQRLNGIQEYSLETIVVDNNSTDETKAVVTEFSTSGRGIIRYLFEGRQGKSYALNTGVQAAHGEILVFTDDDVSLHPDWLMNIQKTFAQHNCLGVGGKIVLLLPEKRPSWLKTDTPTPFMNAFGGFDWGDTSCTLKASPFGANMAFRSEAFRKYGLFRTDMGPSGNNPLGKSEDTEFSSRLLSASETLMYAPDAIVYHPVDEAKMQRGYFEQWYFNLGKASMMRSELPEQTAYIFGVPRYFYRQLLTKGLRWMLTLDCSDRFCRKLELYEIVGALTEASRRHRLNKARR
ncbi:MAG TPA: glycosyltransferase family 2 protein [Nitrospirota bacterium]|nr:glycosyltransferase family 2 protein [Nitrospirota bacterium]